MLLISRDTNLLYRSIPSTAISGDDVDWDAVLATRCRLATDHTRYDFCHVATVDSLAQELLGIHTSVTVAIDS